MTPLVLSLLLGPALADPLAWRHDDAVWRSPTRLERDAMLASVRELIADAEQCAPRTVDRARARLEAVGLRLQEVTVRQDRVIVIGEPEVAWGAGLLAIRCGPSNGLVLQAPHPRFDMRTGPLVRSWFEESPARAAMWATVHRYRGGFDEAHEDEVHPADVAREPGNLFQAMTVALAVGEPSLRFVQLHGFPEESAPDVDAIVSSGERDRPLVDAGVGLGAVVERVAVYGTDLLTLGGTGNAQGDLLARWPGRFLHLELSPTLRDRLSADAVLRARFAKALEGAW